MSIGLSRTDVAARVEDDGEVTLSEFMMTLADLGGMDPAAYSFIAAHLAAYVSGSELLGTLAEAQARYGVDS